MQLNRRQILLGLLLVVPLCLVLAREGKAGPGDIEINQAAAMAGNVTPGDLPGFPIDINTGGNFLLTSPLDVSGEPNPADVTVIRVNASGAEIDLGGKGIIGPTICSPPPAVVCSPTGTGIGILFVSGLGSVHNGAVNGMGSTGIDMTAATFAIIRQVGVFNNAQDGMSLSAGSSATDVTASANGGVGIKIGGGGVLLRATAFNNGSHGIDVAAGSRVADVTSSNNLGSGINLGAAGSIDGCVSNGNGGDGVTAAFGGIVTNCVTVVNGTGGIHVGGNGTITNNNSYSNTGDGIDAGASSTVIGNMAANNTAYGMSLGANTGYQGNVLNSNTSGAVNGASAIETGSNVCAGNTTCP
jgi:hypothetical protein